MLSNLYPTQDGSVLWEVRVHGVWFQVGACTCPTPGRGRRAPAPAGLRRRRRGVRFGHRCGLQMLAGDLLRRRSEDAPCL